MPTWQLAGQHVLQDETQMNSEDPKGRGYALKMELKPAPERKVTSQFICLSLAHMKLVP